MIKILKNHINKNPNFIYKTTAFDIKLYDRVYENWNRPEHYTWLELQDKYKIKILHRFNNKEQYSYKGESQYVGYVFFKDRNDRRNVQVRFSDKNKDYLPNTILILRNDCEMTFSKPESNLPDKPFLVVEFEEVLAEYIKNCF